MPVTTSDILANADTFRAAYPAWPAAEPSRPAQPDVFTVGRIATRWVAGLLDASDAIALLCKAGLTHEDACGQFAAWQGPVTEFIDDTTDWALARADHE